MRLALLLSSAALAFAQAGGDKAAPSAWKKLEFVLGNWVGAAGEKDTEHGAGQGAFSFEPQLNNKVIVRRNHAGYSSGVQHDDLMVIYLEPADNNPRAIYFDTEGHVIRYALAFPSPNAVTFESDAAQPGPRYRLSYRLDDGGTLNGKFEVAPPGAGYKTYLSWTSRKN